jgi:hypothetical protein
LTEDGQPLAKDGEVVFNRLQPGHYRLYLFTEDPVYIKSATFGDQNALNGGLSLRSPSDEVLDITLATSKADLGGIVFGDGGVPVAGADVKLLAQGEDAPFVIKSVVADGEGRFVLKAVPPGNYSLVALSEAVRDREFGTFEFDQVKRWAMAVQVRDVSVTGISLKSTNLRYAASACGSDD